MFSGTADMNIFPASPDEIREHFDDALASIEKKIADKKDELAKLVITLDQAREFVSGQMADRLTEPEHRTMSQREFLTEQKERELQALQ